MFPPLGECFPGMSKTGMTKKRFVVIQGGKLYMNTNTGQVDHWHRREENGLKPSADRAIRMFRKPLAKEGNFVSIARHAGESWTPCILPSVDLFKLAHLNIFAILSDLYHLTNQGNRRKCFRMLTGIVDLPHALNQFAPHTGHSVKSLYASPWNNTHPFLHA